MKSTKLIATVALTSLLAIAGSAFAAGSPHDAYNNAFVGDSGGRLNDNEVAITAVSSTAMDGHEAYNRAILGSAGLKSQVVTTGKAAFGIGSSGVDDHAAYSSTFRGD